MTSATPNPNPQSAPRRRQPEQVRARIVKAALNIFADAGFEGASTRKIAAEAGVSISLLVYHFGSKEGLWQAMMEEIFAQVGSLITEPNTAGLSAADKLAHIIERLVVLFAEYPSVHRLMSLEGHQPSDRLTWICDNFLHENNEQLRRLIEEGQQEGRVIPGDPGQIRMALVAMTAVPFSVSAEYRYLVGRDPFEQAEIAEMIALIKRMILIR